MNIKKGVLIIGILIAAAAATAGFALVYFQHKTDRPQPVRVEMAGSFDQKTVLDNPVPRVLGTGAVATSTPTQSKPATGVPVLMYHHVGSLPPNPDPVRIGLTVTPKNFEEQVAWLKANGYSSVTLQELYDHLQNKSSAWPQKPVVFTFDDGYEDVFANAVPILEKYGYTGAFGIITQFPGTVNGTNVYATWQEIASAKTQGMEIICHTQNHFDGSSPKFDNTYIFQNLSGCQQDILNNVGSAEPFLIYPYGHYTNNYIAQAKLAGFKLALTTREGLANDKESIMALPRVRVSPSTTLEKLQEMITGIFVHTATGSPDLYGK